MELLAELSDKRTGLNSSALQKFKIRKAARAVIIDTRGQVLIQHAVKGRYYKLPGGGAERGESIMQTLRREILEETGYKIKVMKPIGAVIEYRHREKLLQLSYCFLARPDGKQGKTSLDHGEKLAGFVSEWHTKKRALALIKTGKKVLSPPFFIVTRDTLLLKRAGKLI